jgi:hypothetical protein
MAQVLPQRIISISNMFKNTNIIEWCLKWGATVCILLATVATSFDFVPLNKWLFLTGSLAWMSVGFIWRQPSLWSLNLFTTVIYVAGFLY